MKKHIYSLFVVLLVAVFMLNCETGDPLIKPIQAGIDSKDYQTALSATDTAIFKEPTNPLGYYYKGVVLGKIAEAEPVVSKRKPIYDDMRSALEEANLLFDAQEKKSAEAENVTPLILNAWSIEHNEAIKYATDDSAMATVEAPLELSIAHLVNATTINPDSSLSFDVLAQIYYMNSEFENAASALTNVIELEGSGLASEYDRLGSYYFLSEQPDKAVAAMQEGLKLYPDSTALIQKLADGLFQIDRTEEALDIMNNLIDTDPTNARYYLVVGTRVYQQALTLSDEQQLIADKIYDLERNNGSKEELEALKKEDAALQAQIEPLTDRAEQALLNAVKYDDTIASTFNTLGILYQNKASSLYDLRNQTNDNAKADEYDKLAKAEVQKAMGFYEKATELNPDNTTYWASLGRVYLLLDMREKAEEAMNKAGL
tara:strand:+ start:12035 stop:13324 length:1290 start_codon:yes stop_codon:yes gene_type:complete